MLPQSDPIKLRFPLGKYFLQLLLRSNSRIWSPMAFWFKYRVELFEKCLALNALEGKY